MSAWISRGKLRWYGYLTRLDARDGVRSTMSLSIHVVTAGSTFLSIVTELGKSPPYAASRQLMFDSSNQIGRRCSHIERQRPFIGSRQLEDCELAVEQGGRHIVVRTLEEIWSVDVPVGQKLVIRFYPDKAEDNLHNPDVMRWQVYPASQIADMLDNQMPVPAPESRRIEWELRAVPEYAPDRPPVATAPAVEAALAPTGDAD